LILIYPVIKKSNKLENVTYCDGYFYEGDIDPDYYFVKRFLPEAKDNDKDNVIPEDMNSSRQLKGAKGIILVLADNISKENKPDIQLETVTQEDTCKTEKCQNAKSLYKYITYHDYDRISKRKLFICDQRSVFKYITDELIQQHSMIKIFLKDSLIDPRPISFLKLIYRVNLIFVLNALAYTDNLIEKRLNRGVSSIAVTIE
jgi:hypothetical protein